MYWTVHFIVMRTVLGCTMHYCAAPVPDLGPDPPLLKPKYEFWTNCTIFFTHWALRSKETFSECTVLMIVCLDQAGSWFFLITQWLLITEIQIRQKCLAADTKDKKRRMQRLCVSMYLVVRVSHWENVKRILINLHLLLIFQITNRHCLSHFK